jgi:effector-binding domain-containing protein
MDYEVSVVSVEARPTAVVAEATTVHQGSFGDVGAAHDAVVDWCMAQGLRLDRTRWEVYGPHHDDPAQQQTQVFWRLAPSE